MSLLFKLLAASDSRPQLREKQEHRRPGENSVSPDPMSLLFKLLAASDRRPKVRENRSTGGEEKIRFS